MSPVACMLAINNKWLKCVIKAEEQVCRYHLISEHLLDIGMLDSFTLRLHDIASDDVERPWRRAKNGHTLVQNLTLM